MLASRNRLTLALAAIVLIAPALAGRPMAQTRGGERSAVQAPRLKPLAGVDELKSWFNTNREHPRLVLLLSPT